MKDKFLEHGLCITAWKHVMKFLVCSYFFYKYINTIYQCHYALLILCISINSMVPSLLLPKSFSCVDILLKLDSYIIGSQHTTLYRHNNLYHCRVSYTFYVFCYVSSLNNYIGGRHVNDQYLFSFS